MSPSADPGIKEHCSDACFILSSVFFIDTLNLFAKRQKSAIFFVLDSHHVGSK